MNPTTHPHEFIKHTEPDYIIQPGDLYQSTVCSTCYGPFGASVGDALGMSGFKTAWTPRPIPSYDTSKYDYVSDPSYVIRAGDLIWLEPETGWETVNDCTPGRTLAFLNAGLEDSYDNVYGVLTPKNVEPKKPTTIEGWLKTLPDGYRERALKNCARRERADACLDAATAVMSAFAWDETPEGVKFWLAVKNHLLGHGKLPALPTDVAKDPNLPDALHDTIRELRASLERRNEVIVKLVDQIAAMHVALRKIRAAADEASRNTTF